MNAYQYIVDYFNQNDAPDNIEPIAYKFYPNTRRLMFKFKNSERGLDLFYMDTVVASIGQDNFSELRYTTQKREFSIVFKYKYLTEKFYKKYK